MWDENPNIRVHRPWRERLLGINCTKKGELGWMYETSAQGWCTGKTERDWVEREVGGGIRMGNTCKSMADSCQCLAKTSIIS